MTIGIYRLRFEGTDQCYIGQSVDIERRFIDHKKYFRMGLHTPKLMEAYYTYGMPIRCEILCECLPEELNDEEETALELYDSVNNGFNTKGKATGGSGLFGDLHGNSKHSNYQIENALKMLCDPSNTYLKISEKTGVSVSAVGQIASGNSHRWLKNKHPELYATVMSFKGKKHSRHITASAKGKTYPPVVSPEGSIYQNIPNISAFCRERGLQQSHFTKLLNGKAKTHKGWRLAENV